MAGPTVHVRSEGGMWLVEEEGAQEPTYESSVVVEAIEVGLDVARRNRGKLLVHSRESEMSKAGKDSR